jgi:glycosyltransferase involved in cell wall biosynthesis
MDIVSAVICTRNRPQAIVQAVRSLLTANVGNIEIIVIDQSDGVDSEVALQPFSVDARLRYQRSTTRGKGAGLNEAFGMARGAIVTCTDDDCAPLGAWIGGMAGVLASQPDAAIAFCEVRAVPYDRARGYVPTFFPRGNRVIRSLTDAGRSLGLGAGMAVRREFVLSMGGFDESFGPGARFPSADDWDIAVRALLAGRSVYVTDEFAVVHDGFRTFAEGRRHTRRDWIAIGAFCAKPLRARYLKAAVLPIQLFLIDAAWPPIANLLRLRRPSGLIRITAFVEGFARGLMTPVDRRTLRFADARAYRQDRDPDGSRPVPPVAATE